MSLPNPGMDFTAFDALPANSLDDMVENIEALADGTGLDDDAIVTAKIDDGAVTANKLATGAAESSNTAGGATTSTTFTPTLSGTPGTNPSVTVTVGANGLLLVGISAHMTNSGANNATILSFALSGANTVAAADQTALAFQAFANGAFAVSSGSYLLSGLTPGSTTVTLQYRVTNTTGTFSNRRLYAVPL